MGAGAGSDRRCDHHAVGRQGARRLQLVHRLRTRRAVLPGGDEGDDRSAEDGYCITI